jgi:dUTP pyrophosphatase
VVLQNGDPRETLHLRRGDRIAQLVIQAVETAIFTEVDHLPESVRAAGGFGSTGGFGGGSGSDSAEVKGENGVPA